MNTLFHIVKAFYVLFIDLQSDHEWNCQLKGEIENQINLEWITASETNNKYFSVQRSTNGSEFTEIAKVPGAGNSTSMLKYLYKDLNPIPGINYYRLVQYDHDNKTSQSNIVAIRYDSKIHFQLLKNPVSDEVILDIFTETQTDINIEFINNQGQKIYSSQQHLSDGKQLVVVPLNSLSKGTFFIKITYGEGTKWLRMVKI